MATERPLILVTGASGFVATHAIAHLLARSYRVRATTRSATSAAAIAAHHASPALSTALVGNLDDTHAWSASLFKDVTGVLHIASAMPWDPDMDIEAQIIKPAIAGVENLFAALKTHAPSVRRVVYTSSMAAMLDLAKGPGWDHVYSPSDWNDLSIADAVASRDIITGYLASKVHAERAAWAFMDREKPSWSLNVIVPPAVFGQTTQPGATLATLQGQSRWLYEHVNGSLTAPKTTQWRSFVHVADLAAAHVAALETPGAGRRYFVAAGTFSWRDVCEIVRQEFPELSGKVPAPGPWTEREIGYGNDAGLAEVELGLEFRGLRRTVRETVARYLEMEGAERAAKAE